MKTEAEQEKAAAALQGALRSVWEFLSHHHFRTIDDMIVGAKVQPAEARAAVSSLVKAGLIEAQRTAKGEVYRPAPCAVDARVPPAKPRQKEPAAWLETELEAALADSGHALHASAIAFVRRLPLAGIATALTAAPAGDRAAAGAGDDSEDGA